MIEFWGRYKETDFLPEKIRALVERFVSDFENEKLHNITRRFEALEKAIDHFDSAI